MNKSSFARFKQRLRREVLNHPVITANPYTRWFRKGNISHEQARAFLVQFSVFSNEFLFAQVTQDGQRRNHRGIASLQGDSRQRDRWLEYRGRTRDDDELGSLVGTVEGGTFRFGAAHFELLLRMAKSFDLTLADLGKRRFGNARDPAFLRRTHASVRQRGLRRCRGRILVSGKLGCGRVLG